MSVKNEKSPEEMKEEIRQAFAEFLGGISKLEDELQELTDRYRRGLDEYKIQEVRKEIKNLD